MAEIFRVDGTLFTAVKFGVHGKQHIITDKVLNRVA